MCEPTGLGGIRILPQSGRGVRVQLIRRGIVIAWVLAPDFAIAWQQLGDQIAFKQGRATAASR